MLYSLYSAHDKPKIVYPPVKTKKRVDAPKEEKKCPQQAHVDVPDVRPKYKGREYHPIDFVHKRKGQYEIESEMQEELNRKHVPPVKPGVNRKALIEDAQEVFSYKNKAEYLEAKKRATEAKNMSMMPKPQVGKPKRNFNFAYAKRALAHYEEKYGHGARADLFARPRTMEEIRGEQDQELEDLFDAIVDEIEDRQQTLEKIQDMTDAKAKQMVGRIKGEIVDRIGELQKIRELQNK